MIKMLYGNGIIFLRGCFSVKDMTEMDCVVALMKMYELKKRKKLAPF